MLRQLVATIILLAFYVLPAQALTVIPLDLTELHKQAKHISFAECISNQTEMDAQHNMVVTYTTFSIMEHVKGSRQQTITIKQIGGKMPDNGPALSIPGVPSFNVGEKYLLFIPPKSQLGFSSPVGISQGVFRTLNDTSGNTYVTNGRETADLMGNMRERAMPEAAKSVIEKTLSKNAARPNQMLLGDMLTVLRNMQGAQQ